MVEMQALGSSKAMSLQQLLTAPITRIFPRFLWTRQNLGGGSVALSCQLFDRLQGATVAMKLPVQVHVVVQPADWDDVAYLLSRAPQQQIPVTQSNSSVPQALGAPSTGWEEVPAAALPTAASGPGSTVLGPFPACASRSKAGKLNLVKIKHDRKLDSYRSVSGTPGAHDIVLFEQVDECTMVLHLQQAAANRSAVRVGGAPMAAGQDMGLQIFPYTYPCVACQESAAWLPHASFMRVAMPKLLIVSQLPQLHQDAASFPLPVRVEVFAASQDGDTPAVQISDGSIEAKLSRLEYRSGTMFSVATPATGVVAALQGRRVLRMALTADHSLGVLMGPAGSYTPSAAGLIKSAAKRRRDESAPTQAPPVAAAGNHIAGNKSSKASAAGAQQPMLPGAVAGSGPPASPPQSPPPPAAAASCEQPRPIKKSRQQVQAAQDGTAKAAVLGQSAADPADASAAPQKQQVKQQECAGVSPFAAAAAALTSRAAAASCEQSPRTKESKQQVQPAQDAAATAAAAPEQVDAANPAAEPVAAAAATKKQKVKQQQQQDCAGAPAIEAAAAAMATAADPAQKKQHKQSAAEGDAFAQQQRMEKQRADPPVASGAADADAAAAASPHVHRFKKKSSKKQQAVASPAATNAEVPDTVQLQLQHKKQHQQAATADTDKQKQKKGQKNQDRAAEAGSSGAAAATEQQTRKRKGQQHSTAAAAADCDAAERKKRRKAAAAAATADPAAVVQQLIQQQIQWVEGQEQWVEKQQRRLAKKQQQLARQKAQLQAQLVKPSKHKKKHTAAAAEPAEVSPDSPTFLAPFHQLQHNSMPGGSAPAPQQPGTPPLIPQHQQQPQPPPTPEPLQLPQSDQGFEEYFAAFKQQQALLPAWQRKNTHSKAVRFRWRVWRKRQEREQLDRHASGAG